MLKIKIPTKKDLYNLVFGSMILSSYWLTVNTFIAIYKFGSVTYSEPNNLILYFELFLTFVFGIFIFINIQDYLIKRWKEIKSEDLRTKK